MPAAFGRIVEDASAASSVPCKTQHPVRSFLGPSCEVSIASSVVSQCQKPFSSKPRCLDFSYCWLVGNKGTYYIGMIFP